MYVITGLDNWLAARLESLKDQYFPETLAYVIGVLKAQAKPKNEIDMSNRSIVLEYALANENGNFETFQRIGDWVLWVDIIIPQSIVYSKEVVESIGRQSYMSCYRIMHGKWKVYEELADVLPSLALHVRQKIFDHEDEREKRLLTLC